MAEINKGGISIDDATDIQTIDITDNHSTGILSLIASIASEQEEANSSSLATIDGSLTAQQIITSDEFSALYRAVTRGASGDITCTAEQITGWYADEWEAFHEAFPNISITAVYEWIKFADSEVVRILNANGVGSDGYVTKEQLEGVTNVNQWFRNTGITSFDELDLSNVTSIDQSAFSNCTSLTSVDLSNVTSIGRQAFQDCSSLVISELSTELNKVEANAFRGVTFVDGFKIPDSLTDLSIYWNNSWAFNGSKGYLHLNKVQKLDFSGGTNGDVCIIPNTVIEFTVSNINNNGGFGGTVSENKNLIWQDGGTDIIINNRDRGAILNYYTTNLFFIDLPSVLTINNSTYLNGVPRKYNVIRMSIPPVISTDNQQGINATHTIFVYQSSLSAYQSATCWKNYNIKAIGGTEWVTAMKDLYLQHEGKCYNRCTNITDDGYTSSYDNKYYAWTDAFVDYDIFGVDRIE